MDKLFQVLSCIFDLNVNQFLGFKSAVEKAEYILKTLESEHNIK